jgi:hypothetical protein
MSQNSYDTCSYLYIKVGQPAHRSEILSLVYTNQRTRHRDVFLHERYVMTVTQYDKASCVIREHHIIPRFLPLHVDQLLVVYLSGVTSFRQMTERYISEHATLKVTKGFI